MFCCLRLLHSSHQVWPLYCWDGYCFCQTPGGEENPCYADGLEDEEGISVTQNAMEEDCSDGDDECGDDNNNNCDSHHNGEDGDMEDWESFTGGK